MRAGRGISAFSMPLLVLSNANSSNSKLHHLHREGVGFDSRDLSLNSDPFPSVEMLREISELRSKRPYINMLSKSTLK